MAPFEIGQRFQVLARGPVPDPDAIADALRLGVSKSYVDVVSDGADLELLHVSGVDVRIWSPDFVVEMNDVCEIQRWLPGCVAVGDAWGLFIVECGAGLMAFGPGALDPEEGRRIGPGLLALLAGELGELLGESAT